MKARRQAPTPRLRSGAVWAGLAQCTAAIWSGLSSATPPGTAGGPQVRYASMLQAQAAVDDHGRHGWRLVTDVELPNGIRGIAFFDTQSGTRAGEDLGCESLGLGITQSLLAAQRFGAQLSRSHCAAGLNLRDATLTADLGWSDWSSQLSLRHRTLDLSGAATAERVRTEAAGWGLALSYLGDDDSSATLRVQDDRYSKPALDRAQSSAPGLFEALSAPSVLGISQSIERLGYGLDFVTAEGPHQYGFTWWHSEGAAVDRDADTLRLFHYRPLSPGLGLDASVGAQWGAVGGVRFFTAWGLSLFW
ncbi:MAG: hypothetical protein SV583_07405 [Pseudomonadota bacterium]|nr:hypothetical protein [Pseudomonadota bacterium]